jgi:23S rRNA (adenine2503-C2)-methyltransferase
MGETMTHIIFMGMGEPLHNLQEVLKAIEILSSASGVQIPQRKMTVSTSGLLPQLKELAEKTQVLLALTLSAPNDSIRSQIMPVNRKYNLRTTRQTLQELPLRKRRKIFIEYVLLEKINDEITHAEELADLLQDIPCKINLIPFNAIPGFPYSRPSEDRIMAFLKILKKNGLCVSIRKQRGQDILSACGQLSNASFKESPILKNYPTTNI